MIPKDEGSNKAVLVTVLRSFWSFLLIRCSIFRFLTWLLCEWPASPTRLRSAAPLFHSSVKVIQDPIGLSRLLGCNGGKDPAAHSRSQDSFLGARYFPPGSRLQ